MNHPVPELRHDYTAVTYDIAYQQMRERVQHIIAGQERELVWFLEHQHAYTVGATSFAGSAQYSAGTASLNSSHLDNSSSICPEDHTLTATSSNVSSTFQQQIMSGVLQVAEGAPTQLAGVQVFHSDRGGKVTYHGPGQRICYLLLDLRKRYDCFDIKKFIDSVHSCIISLCSRWNIAACRHPDYPGVWVQQGERLSKIAAIGMKVTRGVSYHGFSFNVAPELEYFAAITPCGITDHRLGVTSLLDLGVEASVEEVDAILLGELQKQLLI